MKEQDNKNLEIKTPKRQQMTSGAILEIPINNEYYTYAQILYKSQCAFFDFKSLSPIKDITILANLPVLFITNIYKEVVTKGVWQKIGKLPIRDEFKNPPMQYIYHDYSGKFECYNPMTGKIFPIEKEQAVGLERAAVWDAHHIVDRIYDHYNGTPCKWLKQHYELFKEES